MDVIKVVRPKTLGDLIAFEVDPNYCRESVVHLAGSGAARTCAQFAVVGAFGVGAQTATATAKAGNTGNGLASAVSADAGAPAGDYRVIFIEPAANLGTFAVYLPDGTLDGHGVVGTAYNGSVNFTIADGATDFVAGDEWTINVPFGQGSTKYVQLDLTGTDGRQFAAGICLFDATAADGVDGDMQIEKRGPSIVRSEELVWPAGITAAQKAQQVLLLAALGILVRTSG